MKIFLFLFSLLVFTQTVFAQSKILDSLKTELKTNENPKERFHILNRISDITNFQAGNIDSASVLEMYGIAEKLDNDSLLAVCYNLVGLFFFNKGDNNSALEYLIKGIPLAEKENDKRRLSSLYFDISLVYFNLLNYDEAYKNIIKGGENLPDKSFLNYDYMLVQFQRNMTLYYIYSNQSDSAVRYAQELLETSRRIKSNLYQFASMYLNGSVYSMTGNNELAELYFQKAVEFSDSIEVAEEKLKFYESYIEFLLSNNKLTEAYNQSLQLMQLANQSNDINLKMSGAGYLRQVFEKMNITDSAYYYSKMEMKLSDEIFSYKNLDQIQALAFNEKIRVMEEEVKLAEEEDQKKQRIQYLLLAFGIIILVILYLTFSHKLISNPKLVEFFGIMALLIVFEFLNLILHPILGNITHHSPILMLLGLVCVAAFLVPLHHRAEKWTTEYLARKNKAIKLEHAKKSLVNVQS